MNSLVCLQVETTNLCNGHCVFCPHSRFTEFGTMVDELYQRIVRQAAELPNLQLFIPMLTGEPFCDKNLMGRLRFAREILSPSVKILIYTNGSLLTEGIIRELGKIPNLQIDVSLNATTPDTRKKVMGLDDFHHVVRAIKYMEEAGVSCQMSMVAYPEISSEEARDFIKAGGTIIQYQSWCGEQYPYMRQGQTSCIRAKSYMTVRYDGRVNLCCFDPFGKVVFGDLNNNTIEEVWQSDKHREYQALHNEGRGAQLPLCCSCTEGHFTDNFLNLKELCGAAR
ncbi:GTP 3',8-cyclase [subsurface metagenome]